ncbi:S-adenosylmethionine decarboxylase proenzyme [Anopheles darlingi]|uniref:S-adenosylmethionine decarboxylase proenzyme n=1 Tax=Anopheles darlingi TaxID=43151 RepID=UPI00210003B0|nr:S-adenosylmethionine decarboxylase proenzyme [Anopheles darlingi]
MAETEDISSSSCSGSSSNNSSASGSREDMHFFEGVEKLLEIWFEPNPADQSADLRKIPRPMWDALLKRVRCEIISFARNEQIDAYVLSESSMFVSKRRWILKTCGTTTPLECFEPLLRLAYEIAGYNEIEDLFYSRKNYKRPELQISPHRGFEEEVSFLDRYFDDGRAYSLGAINRDCWHLYTMSRGGGGSDVLKRNSHIHLLYQNGQQELPYELMEQPAEQQQQQQEEAELQLMESDLMMQPLPDPDQTIEILMTELDPKVMAIFTKEECSTANEATQKSGIHLLIPGMVIDDYLFDPCGYSMNGISKSCGKKYKEGCYMTIHITPESQFSYVSFESNIASSAYAGLISRVIRTFQPGKFIVTVFANQTSPAANANREIENLGTIDQWKRRDIQYSRVSGYDLTYAQYCKYPS